MSRIYESTSPAGKMKGLAEYLMDKYMSLGQNTSDPILSQTYFQYAEHYRREMNNNNNKVRKQN